MLLDEKTPMDYSARPGRVQSPEPTESKGLDLSNSVLEKVCQKIMRKVAIKLFLKQSIIFEIKFHLSSNH